MDDDVIYVVLIGLLIVFYFVGLFFWNSAQCSRDGSMMQTDSQYKIIGGCYLNQGNVYVPERMFKGIIINKDNR